MLRCVKWFPLAGLLSFLAMFGLGWLLVRSPEKHIQPPPQVVTRGYTFVAYSPDGKKLDSDTKIKGFLVNKQEHDPSEADDVSIVPKGKDELLYKERTVRVVWLNEAEFEKWLDQEFKKEVSIGGTVSQQWTEQLTWLRKESGKVTCKYPVILPPKRQK